MAPAINSHLVQTVNSQSCSGYNELQRIGITAAEPETWPAIGPRHAGTTVPTSVTLIDVGRALNNRLTHLAE